MVATATERDRTAAALHARFLSASITFELFEYFEILRFVVSELPPGDGGQHLARRLMIIKY